MNWPRRSLRITAEIKAESNIAAAAERVADAERLVNSLADERATLQQGIVEAKDRHERARESVNRTSQIRSQIAARSGSLDGRANGLNEQIAKLDDTFVAASI